MTPITKPVAALRVGVSALFDPEDTPHARTFMRALAVARNGMPELKHVQWRFLDDGAHAIRGAAVAQQMIGWKADIVVGHFSSDAAIGAAPLYEQAGIALLTPAATIDRLTMDHHNVFRCCPSDRRLAGDLVNWLASRGWRRVQVKADDSAHGQALAAAISQALSREGLQPGDEHAEVEVFAGRLKASREHWRARRSAGSTRPLVLTDDAASPHLGCAPEQDRNTFVIGFGTLDSTAQGCHASALHRTLFASEPHTYFRESLLMLYVLAGLASGRRNGPLPDALHCTVFDTPLGAVSFDRGECRSALTRIWALGPAGLTPAQP
ncbi:ABC transporter substrate-binding protein [Pseudomonas syringae]|uniref:ABC transporter substrate-binding protein n=1 Tax=Pseudomonas syringae TaxID=317 RepID=UPI001CA88288|nr:ABC transporter substrate-binding protein [Pseudomonas syringae]MCI3945803.1 ABC transporter substrate-binding protein [Pseudomonas syringae]